MKQLLMCLVLAVGVMLTQPVMAAGPAPIELKSCAHFTILAYSTITSTGGGTINGDMGLSPVGSLTGFPPATNNGTFYNGDSNAAQAQVDLAAAIIAASPAQLPGGLDVGSELGGLDLAPGVYKSGSSYDITSVDLTLSGGPDDVWVFQMVSTLTVGTGCKVILSGGAQARNIFWQVGSSATLGTSSEFKGTIMAYASISMLASSTLDGRALAQTGAVTFNGARGALPTPEAPRFINISRSTDDVVVVLSTTPYFLLTLETNPNLLLTNWTPIATDTPVTSPWTFTNVNILAGAPRLFYRAFITAY
jgi:hypothetical protein